MQLKELYFLHCGDLYGKEVQRGGKWLMHFSVQLKLSQLYYTSVEIN